MRSNWLRDPATGPALHAAAGLLAALLSAGIGYVTDPSDPFQLGAPVLGLLGVLGQALVAWLRNNGAVAITSAEGNVVKAIRADGGEAVLTTARRVVSNDDPVLVLRGRPSHVQPVRRSGDG